MFGQRHRHDKRSIVALVALLGAFGLGLVALHFSAYPARAQQSAPSDRAAVLSALFTTVNNGDIGGAAAVFANNAVFIGALRAGNCSQSAPCTDPASIHQQLTSVAAIHTCFVLRSLDVSGAVVTGQLETHNDNIRANGIDYVLQDFIALVPAGQITFWANLTDIADPQTALNAAINAGTQSARAPIPNPATPCGAA
jgi:hypothetical protein